MVVIKTMNGNGANAGVVVDRLNYEEVVGSIAGDDTVFTVCKTPEAAQEVMERLTRIAKA